MDTCIGVPTSSLGHHAPCKLGKQPVRWPRYRPVALGCLFGCAFVKTLQRSQRASGIMRLGLGCSEVSTADQAYAEC